MADNFTLTPDDHEGLLEPSRRQLRLPTDLAPTAAVPAPRRTPDRVCSLAPCETCGSMVLVGRTPSGQRLALDAHVQTYTVLWQEAGAQPMLAQSRAYPLHRCGAPPAHP